MWTIIGVITVLLIILSIGINIQERRKARRAAAEEFLEEMREKYNIGKKEGNK